MRLIPKKRPATATGATAILASALCLVLSKAFDVELSLEAAGTIVAAVSILVGVVFRERGAKTVLVLVVSALLFGCAGAQQQAREPSPAETVGTALDAVVGEWMMMDDANAERAERIADQITKNWALNYGFISTFQDWRIGRVSMQIAMDRLKSLASEESLTAEQKGEALALWLIFMAQLGKTLVDEASEAGLDAVIKLLGVM